MQRNCRQLSVVEGLYNMNDVMKYRESAGKQFKLSSVQIFRPAFKLADRIHSCYIVLNLGDIDANR